MHATYENIRETMRKSVDSSPRALSVFFKTGVGEYAESDRFLGIKTPTLRGIAKKFQSAPFSVLKQLLWSNFNEERLLAMIILVQQYQNKNSDTNQKNAIYQFYLNSVERINNWNLVDASAYHIVGAHLWDKDRSTLMRLAQAKNMWERRISIVATFYFIRRRDFEYTMAIARLFFQDSQDLIHKASGWMLRNVGHYDVKALTDFLDQYASHMPRVMLRYAIERLSPHERQYYRSKK